MENKEIHDKIKEYLVYLVKDEKSLATQKQYYREILRFFEYLNFQSYTKEDVICYKEKLKNEYQPVSVNAKIAALNSFFTFTGQSECKVKQLKIQRRAFCLKEKELTKKEYLRLVNAAKQRKNEKLSLILQTICGTGIRVSELCFITVEAVKRGEAVVKLKGKNRMILIGGKLRKLLLSYLGRQGISSGAVFITKSGKPLDRSNIWKMMKGLCETAHVDSRKVFPHNLRHLFARCFYGIDKDIAKLADVLGHSSINTTRIYIISSGQEHRKQMESMGLVV